MNGYYDDENRNGEPNGNDAYGDMNNPEENRNQESENHSESDYYGGNIQYQWHYDDYQKAMQSKTPKKKNKGLKAFIISVGSIFLALIVGLAGVGVWSLIKDSRLGLPNNSSETQVRSGPTLTQQNKPVTSSSSPASATSPIQMSTEQVVGAVSPSVVSIETYQLPSAEVAAEGSGIIMDSNGYIITNTHVIEGADKIEVILSNSKSYGATVVGADVRTDIAVIKIDASGLKAATFGNSDELKVGEAVLAIGSPGGLDFSGSVTDGIVSALNRKVTIGSNTSSSYSMRCIQTNAAINPGNSGGALVNMYGQVVGITSAKIAASGFEGMGFAIPINTATPIINSLIKYGYVKDRVKIGIGVREITEYQSTAFNLPIGLYVDTVDTNSDAYAKGIQSGDIIIKINGIDVKSYDQFYEEESKFKPGNSITLTIFRSSNRKTFNVKVVLAEDKGTAAPMSTPKNNNQGFGSFFGQGN